ncbi:unnamed protein product [Auanema sp. JU1783]|nr:unnamed protein product [Auanema sp. JU1783]
MTETPPIDLSMDYDVVIAGAGLAGLTAARELQKRSPELRVLVIEAKDRVGGRTLGVEMKGSRNRKESFDLGGQWVGNTQKCILDLMDELKLEKYPQYTAGLRQAVVGRSKTRTYEDAVAFRSFKHFSFGDVIDLGLAVWKIDNLAKKIDPNNVFKWKDAQEYDDMTLATWIKTNCWSRTTIDAFHILSRSLYGSEPNKVNMLYHLVACKAGFGMKNIMEDVGDGAQAYRIKGGAHQFCTKLAKQVGHENIWLNQSIASVETFENSATTAITLLQTDGTKTFKNLKCSRLILAIPPHECNKIEFRPGLPNAKKRLFDSIPPGHYIKCIITYETTFWRDLGFSGSVISTGRSDIPGEVLPISFVHDDTSENGVPALVVLLNDEFADYTTEERCNLVTNDLMRFFGEKAMLEFVDYKDKVWSKEPFNGGCPVSSLPPGCMEYWQSYRDPFYTVHFGGTETARNHMGYMSGAVESGLRTAHEVLQELEKFNLVSYNYLEGTKYDSTYQPPLTRTDSYSNFISPWWRRLFFGTCVCLGIIVYSKKYKLSFFAKSVKPIENRLVLWTTGLKWPT